jgi:hypothetical protein
MLTEIDLHIVSRLKKIRFNNKELCVYDYIPDREKGIANFPCIFYLHHEIVVRSRDKRPDEWITKPGGETVTVEQPPEFGGGTFTGEDFYLLKPFPTPVDLIYEIGAVSTKKSDHNRLVEAIFQAFPPGYTVKIGEHYPLFIHGKPIVSDSLDLPIFQTSFVMTVTDIWIDRLEEEKQPSIKTIQQITELQGS